MAGFVQEPSFEEAPEVRHGHTVGTNVSKPNEPMYTAAQVFALIDEAVHAVHAQYK